MNCRRCGNQIIKGDKFCRKCGLLIENNFNDNVEFEPIKNSQINNQNLNRENNQYMANRMQQDNNQSINMYQQNIQNDKRNWQNRNTESYYNDSRKILNTSENNNQKSNMYQQNMQDVSKYNVNSNYGNYDQIRNTNTRNNYQKSNMYQQNTLNDFQNDMNSNYGNFNQMQGGMNQNNNQSQNSQPGYFKNISQDKTGMKNLIIIVVVILGTLLIALLVIPKLSKNLQTPTLETNGYTFKIPKDLTFTGNDESGFSFSKDNNPYFVFVVSNKLEGFDYSNVDLNFVKQFFSDRTIVNYQTVKFDKLDCKQFDVLGSEKTYTGAFCDIKNNRIVAITSSSEEAYQTAIEVAKTYKYTGKSDISNSSTSISKFLKEIYKK